MYTIIKTRMNLVYTITLLLQFNVYLTKEHLTTVRYTLRYLNSIRNLKLFYSKEQDLKLKDYYDLFFAFCSDIRRFYSENAFRLADYIII